MKIIAAVLAGFLLFSCAGTDPETKKKAAEEEILAAEKAFAKAVAEKGVRAGFVEFADDSAVINRGGKTHSGKKAIDSFYSHLPYRDVHLSWTPSFVEASSSGDLGYTWGPYSFAAVDSSGKEIRNEGIFHTVWKKGKDGSWRFVYD